jgi:hypothetical protein
MLDSSVNNYWTVLEKYIIAYDKKLIKEETYFSQAKNIL